MRLMDSSVQIRIHLFIYFNGGWWYFLTIFSKIFAMHISFLVNSLFKSFVHFYWFIMFLITEFWEFYMWFGNQFFIRHTFRKYFVLVCTLFFHLLTNIFWKKFLILIKSNSLIILVILSFASLSCEFLLTILSMDQYVILLYVCFCLCVFLFILLTH